MEDRKLYYLQQFLEQSNAMSLDNYLLTIRQLADKARKCYEEPINLEEDKFVEMLLLDGCFIIEFLRACLDESLQVEADICRDLLLMENQLPFFVLSQLSPNRDILTPSLRFVESLLNLTSLETTGEIRVCHVDHLLGLLHYRLSSTFPQTVAKSREDLSWNVINSATELQEAGVRFKKTDAINFCDIKFEKGVLKIAHLIISPTTEYLFRNLITYEQCDPKCHYRRLVSEYIVFMDLLINSSNDVELLRRQEIIENWAGDDETICLLINTISKEVVVNLDAFSYSGVLNRLNKHCKKPRRLWMATLRRNYFNSPWALVSFGAAVVLLCLTVAQTIFSALSYAG